MYDPSLDFQLQAGQRGYQDLLFDTSLAGSREQQDAARQREQLQQTYGQRRDDVDLQRSRYEEDYGRNVNELQRQFRLLGGNQAARARQYGVASGGAALLSQQRRNENQNRQLAGMDQARQRFFQDTSTQQNRLAQGMQQGLQDLDLGLTRSGENRINTVDRAQRELTFAGLDTDALRRFQAIAAGWRPYG